MNGCWIYGVGGFDQLVPIQPVMSMTNRPGSFCQGIIRRGHAVRVSMVSLVLLVSIRSSPRSKKPSLVMASGGIWSSMIQRSPWVVEWMIGSAVMFWLVRDSMSPSCWEMVQRALVRLWGPTQIWMVVAWAVGWMVECGLIADSR